MAFDGITIAALTAELAERLVGGRIAKIAQPEKDELLLTIKPREGQCRLLLSADASLPLAVLTEENKKAPMTAPSFCMLLRKHIAGGRILSITQPGLERIIEFRIEHLNEMGDLCQKLLIVELMGKHSNIIFCDDKGMILDAIKHISSLVSSVREVLPGREYFRVQTTDKTDLLLLADDVAGSPAGQVPAPAALRKVFDAKLFTKPAAAARSFYQSFTGISPVMAQELCYRSGIDADRPWEAVDEEKRERFVQAVYELLGKLAKGNFSPCLVIDQKERRTVEFGVFAYEIYSMFEQQPYESVSALLLAYYGSKARQSRIRQKSADLRHIVTVALERQSKKLDLQIQQLKDTEKREQFKVWGELLHTYGYQARGGEKSLTVPNYYTGEDITIPLDPQKTAMENAARFFDRYGKLKRTYENLSVLVTETEACKEHLESVMTALEIAENEEDLAQIRDELADAGYIRSRAGGKKKTVRSSPLHFISSDGFDIYVGKNNFQNEEITFGLATGNDWWFHAKKRPGSHVILRTGGKEVPDRAFEEAGRLAAHFSKSDTEGRIEVDYIQKKHVKKPAGANPGFVVYYTNYSMLIDGDISALQKVSD